MAPEPFDWLPFGSGEKGQPNHGFGVLRGIEQEKREEETAISCVVRCVPQHGYEGVAGFPKKKKKTPSRTPAVLAVQAR